MIRADYVVVGAGLTGATIARTLADAGREVVVVERRDRVGGNCADAVHPCGVRYNLHGPHYFRTNCDRIWEWVQRFGEFHPFEARLETRVEPMGTIPWPVHSDHVGWIERDHEWKPARIRPQQVANFEQACLYKLPLKAYELLVKGYTEKQWGCRATQLDAKLADRFEVRTDGETRLSRHKYQGVPKDGYSRWIERMLEGTEVSLNTILEIQGVSPARRKLIWTGPIDAYFGHDLGRLRYRTQERLHQWLPNMKQYQNVVQVNEPDPAVPHVRCIEWKHMRPDQRSLGTLITLETPRDSRGEDEHEYPMQDAANRELYHAYAKRCPGGVVFAGRLGLYRYYDMDQSCAHGMAVAKELLEECP